MPWCEEFAYGTTFYWILFALLIWQWPWKGLALWRAAKKNQIIWFIVFFMVNSAAILEILYIFWWSKLGEIKKECRLCQWLKKIFKH